MKKAVFAAVAAAALSLPSLAFAQFYVGGSLGQNSARFDSNDFATGLAAVTETQDKKETAYKLFVGYDFSKFLAVEAGYANLGTPTYRYAFGAFTGAAEMDQSALFVAAKGTFAVNERFGVFGKLGLTRNKAEVTGSTNSPALDALVGTPFSASKSKVRPLIGIGAEWNMNKNLSLRAELEDFGKFGDTNTTGVTKARLFSIGAAYRF